MQFEVGYCILVIVELYLPGGNKMSRSYKKLWKLMIDKEINKTELTKKAKISTNAMANLGRNESVPLETLEKICAVLDCTLDDIVEFSEDENKA